MDQVGVMMALYQENTYVESWTSERPYRAIVFTQHEVI